MPISQGLLRTGACEDIPATESHLVERRQGSASNGLHQLNEHIPFHPLHCSAPTPNDLPHLQDTMSGDKLGAIASSTFLPTLGRRSVLMPCVRPRSRSSHNL